MWKQKQNRNNETKNQFNKVSNIKIEIAFLLYLRVQNMNDQQVHFKSRNDSFFGQHFVL